MRSYIAPLSIICVMLFITNVYSTSLAPPNDSKIYSKNKHFYIDFKNSASQQKVFINKTKPLAWWNFTYLIEFDDSLFISNNGKNVIIIRSKFVKNEDLKHPALMIVNYRGTTKEFNYLQLSNPRKYMTNEVGPIGDFWRIWREKITVTGNDLYIKTAKGTTKINMNTGLLHKQF